MIVKRCDACEFWEAGAQFGPEEDRHIDDRRGSCRRKAPHPTLGDFELELLRNAALISIMVIDQCRTEEESQEDAYLKLGIAEQWEEACLQEATWPTTTGSDWCGEWQHKEERP